MPHLTFLTPTRRTGVRKVRCALVGVLLIGVLAACGGSSEDAYCGVVKDNQQHLSTVLGDGGNAALIDALPIFRSLQGKAPSDIRQDWDTIVSRLTALQDALTKAGVDPTKYDAKHPPAGVTAAQQQAIAGAATTLGSSSTVTALNAVQQQARDVCHTPLSV